MCPSPTPSASTCDQQAFFQQLRNGIAICWSAPGQIDQGEPRQRQLTSRRRVPAREVNFRRISTSSVKLAPLFEDAKQFGRTCSTGSPPLGSDAAGAGGLPPPAAVMLRHLNRLGYLAVAARRSGRAAHGG
jgi:hypothetical protein